jgi:hypothetical protein
MKSYAAIVAIAVAYLWMQYDDHAEQERAEAHRIEAIAAYKTELKRQRAEVMGDLAAHANQMLYPCCQMVVK